MQAEVYKAMSKKCSVAPALRDVAAESEGNPPKRPASASARCSPSRRELINGTTSRPSSGQESARRKRGHSATGGRRQEPPQLEVSSPSSSGGSPSQCKQAALGRASSRLSLMSVEDPCQSEASSPASSGGSPSQRKQGALSRASSKSSLLSLSGHGTQAPAVEEKSPRKMRARSPKRVSPRPQSAGPLRRTKSGGPAMLRHSQQLPESPAETMPAQQPSGVALVQAPLAEERARLRVRAQCSFEELLEEVAAEAQEKQQICRDVRKSPTADSRLGETPSDGDVWLVPSFVAERAKPLEELRAMLSKSPPAGSAAALLKGSEKTTRLRLGRQMSLPDEKKKSGGTRTEPEVQRPGLRRAATTSSLGSRAASPSRASLGSRPESPISRVSSKASVARPSLVSRSSSKQLSRKSTKQHVTFDEDLEMDTPPPPPPRPPSDLVQLAKSFGMPFNVAKRASDVFRMFFKEQKETRPDFDVLRDGQLTPEQFRTVFGPVRENRGQTSEEALIQADADGNGAVDFKEFAFWFYCGGFSEGVLLSREERKVRDFARMLNITVDEVDRYKRHFEKCDLDGNGWIDYNEFAKLVTDLLKVPNGMQLDGKRLQHFWREADKDGSGTIDFEEFVFFYRKHFSESAAGSCPFESYYSGIRPVMFSTSAAA
uniref:EF-hand domain-containing protein n=1 Tax=Alexandrium catenella TaxID=2925 RepID=A0A7S1WXR0_ALECA